MVEERVLIKKDFPKIFFNHILVKRNINLKKLSTELDVSYSTVKNWKAGKFLIPVRIFEKLLGISDQHFQKVINKKVVVKSSNWGQILGGQAVAKKFEQKMKTRMQYIRKFKETVLIPSMDSSVWELFGICLGDGCLSKYFSNSENIWRYEVAFTGHRNDDREYYNNFLLPLLHSKFLLKTKARERSYDNTIRIHIRSKKIFDFFQKIGMPVGKKKGKLRISKNILESSKQTKAAILRGLLDTDGQIFARKDENYRYPYLIITSADQTFLKQLKKIIREFDLPAYIHTSNVVIRGGENLKNWMKLIDSSHPIHKARYEYWKNTGKLFPKGSWSNGKTLPSHGRDSGFDSRRVQ